MRLVSKQNDNKVAAGVCAIVAEPFDPATNTNQKPVPMLTASKNIGTAPFQVDFNTSASFDPDGTIIARIINFADGQPSKQTGIAHLDPDVTTNIAHIFHRQGAGSVQQNVTLNVELKVIDNLGESATTTLPIKVRPFVAKNTALKSHPQNPYPHPPQDAKCHQELASLSACSESIVLLIRYLR